MYALAGISTLEKYNIFDEELRRHSRKNIFVKEGLVWNLEIFLDSDLLFDEGVYWELCSTSVIQIKAHNCFLALSLS